MKENITIRQATMSDISDLVRLRRIMFESMGFNDPNQLNSADQAATEYFTNAIPKNHFYGWLAISTKGNVIGSGGLVIDQHPPGPTNLSGQIGYIMNLVTVPQYRRRGIARRVMQTMLDWLRNSNIVVSSLHATKEGKPLYEELGFEDSNEMRLELT